jgi:hypothetical protein
LAALVATMFAAGPALAQDDKPELKITLGVRGAMGQLTSSTTTEQEIDGGDSDKSATSKAAGRTKARRT